MSIPTEPFVPPKPGRTLTHNATASFADFVLVGLLQFIKRTDEKNFDRLVGIEPALKELYDAAKPWLERDDY